MSKVAILSPREIEAMRVVGLMAAETLLLVGRQIRAGMSTDDINTLVYEDTIRRGARPSQLGFHGFPKSVCTSRNDVVCHGVPNADHVLAPGDIVNVDITSNYGGYHGDTSATLFVGTPSHEARHVVEVAKRSLELGIAQVREGAFIGDIGAAIEEFAVSQGCTIVRDYGGHGIGRRMHAEPHVAHYGTRGKGMRLKAGMAFTIEPMVNLGRSEVEHLDDGWTVVTVDGSLSAQFEHTIVVTKTGCEIMTARPEALLNCEIFTAA